MHPFLNPNSGSGLVRWGRVQGGEFLLLDSRIALASILGGNGSLTETRWARERCLGWIGGGRFGPRFGGRWRLRRGCRDGVGWLVSAGWVRILRFGRRTS